MGTIRFFRHSTQFFRHYIPTEFIVLGVLEFIALTLSFYVGLELRFFWANQEPHLGPLLPKALVFGVVMLMSLVALGAYQRQSHQSIEMLALRIGSGLMLGLVSLGMTYYIVPMFFLGRGAIALAVLVSFFAIMLLRVLFYRIEDKRDMRPRVLVLGAGETAQLVKQAAEDGELNGLNIVGYAPMPGDKPVDTEFETVAVDDSLVRYVEEERIDQIVLAADDRRQGLPAQGLLDCKMSGVDVLDLLTFFERETGKIRIDILHPSWLYLSEGFRESAFRRMAKRLFDISVSLVMLPFVLPLMVFATVAILIESRGKGPVLYRQTRVSENGKPFSIYKFRSMCTDAEMDGKAVWASKNDSRITRVGAVLRKCRVDEVPQLFNVLKGDMSFVGPRPERPEFVQQLADAIPYYNERHRVKPGLTGWAQIRYSYGASEEDGRQKLQYDLYYVKNYNIFMDLLILLQTAEVVLLGKGAH